MTKINHPFLISLRYAFQTKSNVYLVMPFVAGGELFHHLSKEGLLLEVPRCYCKCHETISNHKRFCLELCEILRSRDGLGTGTSPCPWHHPQVWQWEPFVSTQTIEFFTLLVIAQRSET